MGWYLVRLKFNSPLHVGSDEASVGVEGVRSWIHSDTIFSALCNIWAGDKKGEEILGRIKEGDFTFRLSSAFPYKQQDKQFTYFLPRPLLPGSTSFDVFSSRVKKAEFLTLAQFEGWIRGDIRDDSGAADFGIGAKDTSFCIEQVRPRHSSDRETMASSIYYCGEVFFKKGAGLYFIIETSETKDFLNYSLELLSYYGLGGERNIGYGTFSYELEELAENSQWMRLRQVQGNAHCLVSLYYPDEKEKREIQNSALAYGLVLRKGWFHSKTAKRQMKRNTCRMFSEGSIFKSVPKGCIPDLKPEGFSEHPIHRCGLAMSFPIKLREEDYA